MNRNPRQLNYRPIDCLSRCDICGKGRSTGKHRRCSEIRKAKYAQ